MSPCIGSTVNANYEQIASTIGAKAEIIAR